MKVPFLSSAKAVTLGSFKRCVASFLWQEWHFLAHSNMFHTMSTIDPCGKRHFEDLHRHFAWQVHQLRRVALRAFANPNVRDVSSGDNLESPWQALHFVTCADIEGRFARNNCFLR